MLGVADEAMLNASSRRRNDADGCVPPQPAGPTRLAAGATRASGVTVSRHSLEGGLSLGIGKSRWPRAAGFFTGLLGMKPVGEPDAGNPHVRFDEREVETEHG